MQQRVSAMIGRIIRATDGDLGKVHEFYFDDVTWTIRYMVAETGNWLSGRKVLIPLVALRKPDSKSDTFSVDLSCAQVRNSPDVDTERPVYRQHEEAIHEHYHWPPYWEAGYGGTLGLTPYPLLDNPPQQESGASQRKDDPHLRSTRHVKGYHIHAIDGEIGHVEDFIVNDENWTIQFLIVDTGNWLPGKKVFMPPSWIKEVNWDDSSVYIGRTVELVKNSPEFQSSDPTYRNLASHQ
ncbi:MAG: PRC-barrel domain-containing protein [Bacteroidota bacterium]|nr:PRC-barrel domain-containing protein [Bacteroidota bacterium]